MTGIDDQGLTRLPKGVSFIKGDGFDAFVLRLPPFDPMFVQQGIEISQE
jgi:hypothetical protein